MIKNSLAAFGHAARSLFRRPGALLFLCALYLAALACAYYFFATGVATAGQLLVSAVTALLAPLLFFILQAAVANYAHGAPTAGALARRALRDFWKVLLISLPVVALGVAVYYLLGWIENRLPQPAAAPAPPVFAPRTAVPPAAPSWQEVLTTTLRLLAYGFALPILAAHLWLAVAARGLGKTLKSLHRVAAAAYAPRSVLVYAVGVIFFGLLPYFVIRTVTPVTNGWAELFVFGLRLALAFALTLWGWTLTLTALASHGPADHTAEPAAESSAAGDEPQPEPAGA